MRFELASPSSWISRCPHPLCWGENVDEVTSGTTLLRKLIPVRGIIFAVLNGFCALELSGKGGQSQGITHEFRQEDGGSNIWVWAPAWAESPPGPNRKSRKSLERVLGHSRPTSLKKVPRRVRKVSKSVSRHFCETFWTLLQTFPYFVGRGSEDFFETFHTFSVSAWRGRLLLPNQGDPKTKKCLVILVADLSQRPHL